METDIGDFSFSKRYSFDELKEQMLLLEGNSHITSILNLMPQMCFVLNSARQIIYCNQVAVEGLSYSNAEELIGSRFGEAVQCDYCNVHPGGCGTSLHCLYCNARKITDLNCDEASVDSTKISTKTGNVLDVRIKIEAFEVEANDFSFVIIEDISNELRKERLEKIFFHDVLNTAGVIRGYTEVLVMKNKDSDKELSHSLINASNDLIEEIRFQRDLLLAEDDRLISLSKLIPLFETMSEIVDRFSQELSQDGIIIALDVDPYIRDFYTDPVLFRRIIDNLLRNAVEASVKGDVIQVLCHLEKGKIKLQVINPAVMEAEIFVNLFKGDFSTKGKGRGLGTQSVKLLTERYLKGRITCESREGIGTVFTLWLPLKRGD